MIAARRESSQRASADRRKTGRWPDHVRRNAGSGATDFHRTIDPRRVAILSVPTAFCGRAGGFLKTFSGLSPANAVVLSRSGIS